MRCQSENIRLPILFLFSVQKNCDPYFSETPNQRRVEKSDRSFGLEVCEPGPQLRSENTNNNPKAACLCSLSADEFDAENFGVEVSSFPASGRSRFSASWIVFIRVTARQKSPSGHLLPSIIFICFPSFSLPKFNRIQRQRRGRTTT